MGSGGARSRSGPAPDPNALRRDRADDKGWTTLPAEGFQGGVPDFPLVGALSVEVELWDELWRKPQAFMWSKLGLKYQLAAYVRAFIESTEAKASAGLKTAVLRMEGELGLSMPGMASLRWKFSEDEMSERRSAPALASGSSVKSRLAAAKGA
jgi:hypothetical protein